MRKSIRTRLMSQISVLKDRVIEPHMASADQEKPYAVVLIGDESGTNIREGFDLNVQVWVYVERTTFSNIDALADSVILALNKIDLVTASGKRFRLRYTGSPSGDVYDPEWKALTKRLDFVTESIRA